MTTTVFFVRHGSHDRLGHVLCGRMAGVGLGEAGRREAQVLAERLKGESLAAVYSSPLERTQQTAEPIAQAAALPLQTADDLIEIDFGEWTGAGFDALNADLRWAAWNAQRSIARPPGGESMLEVQVRLRRWLDEVRARHPDQKIAAVSHADAIKAALAHALGLSLDQHHRLEVSPGSISVLVTGDWGMKVQSINEVPR
ncbi:histidine phosphatase family protein [Phenylobacterium deserti]|uniref:Histidine phosphatase family protein n=1 Tax=Phenylobacterium deserti TaxID=1914756 RepID=A0A328ADT6_9CAUL|nr:histidine phosphatase family protein [Phenylobacterium deserti]RAK52810.1 histidine phosphatase family protein [Phenylobacterium deserti]